MKIAYIKWLDARGDSGPKPLSVAERVRTPGANTHLDKIQNSVVECSQ